MENAAGTVDCLNTGRGHLQLSFNSADPIEVDRARRAVIQMLQSGYALFVHGEGDTLHRVKRFDATKDSYVIADIPITDENDSAAGEWWAEHQDDPSGQGAAVDVPQPMSNSGQTAEIPPPKVQRRGRKGKPHKLVPAKSAKVTAVGRSAGG